MNEILIKIPVIVASTGSVTAVIQFVCFCLIIVGSYFSVERGHFLWMRTTLNAPEVIAASQNECINNFYYNFTEVNFRQNCKAAVHWLFV